MTLTFPQLDAAAIAFKVADLVSRRLVAAAVARDVAADLALSLAIPIPPRRLAPIPGLALQREGGDDPLHAHFSDRGP